MNKIIVFIKWLWGWIALPVTFQEFMKEVKILNEKLDSPTTYLAKLEFAEKMYNIQLGALRKEKDSLAKSDSKQIFIIEELMRKLEMAHERIKELIVDNTEIITQRDTFKKNFDASEKERQKLKGEVEKSKVLSVPWLEIVANLPAAAGASLSDLWSTAPKGKTVAEALDEIVKKNKK